MVRPQAVGIRTIDQEVSLSVRQPAAPPDLLVAAIPVGARRACRRSYISVVPGAQQSLRAPPTPRLMYLYTPCRHTLLVAVRRSEVFRHREHHSALRDMIPRRVQRSRTPLPGDFLRQ